MEMIRQLDLSDYIRRALAEDVGQGDITTAATVAPGQLGRAIIKVKEPRMILAGGFLIEQVFAMTGAEPKTLSLADEGSGLKAGETLAEGTDERIFRPNWATAGITPKDACSDLDSV